jgi:hypothetical protein
LDVIGEVEFLTPLHEFMPVEDFRFTVFVMDGLREKALRQDIAPFWYIAFAHRVPKARPTLLTQNARRYQPVPGLGMRHGNGGDLFSQIFRAAFSRLWGT